MLQGECLSDVDPACEFVILAEFGPCHTPGARDVIIRSSTPSPPSHLGSETLSDVPFPVEVEASPNYVRTFVEIISILDKSGKPLCSSNRIDTSALLKLLDQLLLFRAKYRT